MKLKKTIKFVFCFSIIFICSCNKHMVNSKTRGDKYIIIDGEKVEINSSSNIDSANIIIDSSYYKNKTIPREYIKKKVVQ